MQKFAEQIIKKVGSVESVIFHTIFIVGIFSTKFLGLGWNTVLLLLTTILSVEAIYLELLNLIINNKLIAEKE